LSLSRGRDSVVARPRGCRRRHGQTWCRRRYCSVPEVACPTVALVVLRSDSCFSSWTAVAQTPAAHWSRSEGRVEKAEGPSLGRGAPWPASTLRAPSGAITANVAQVFADCFVQQPPSRAVVDVASGESAAATRKRKPDDNSPARSLQAMVILAAGSVATHPLETQPSRGPSEAPPQARCVGVARRKRGAGSRVCDANAPKNARRPGT
jgi:hypothetical protein